MTDLEGLKELMVLKDEQISELKDLVLHTSELVLLKQEVINRENSSVIPKYCKNSLEKRNNPEESLKKGIGIEVSRDGNVKEITAQGLTIVGKNETFPKKYAFGIDIKKMVENDIGTVIVNDQAFLCYNYSMDYDQIKMLVDKMDQERQMEGLIQKGWMK
jgi:hypothetical protein